MIGSLRRRHSQRSDTQQEASDSFDIFLIRNDINGLSRLSEGIKGTKLLVPCLLRKW